MSNVYDVEISLSLRAESQELAWEQVYRLVHDLLENKLLAGRITDCTVSEPDEILEDKE